MSKQQMVSETRGIGQLLNERRYFLVPPHQRDYAWPLGAVEQFLDDVVGAMQDGGPDYFLGLLVLVDTENPEERRYEILDGQQRLATTTMVYAAIRQWLRDNGEDDEAGKLQKEFIGISEIGESEDEPRLILNVNNRDTFEEAVVNPCSEADLRVKQSQAGRHTSNRKHLDAALKCREFIQGLAEGQGSTKKHQAAILFRLAKYLRDQVQVNCLDVTAAEDAYTIFESLNDRGIELSVLDLLKNHLLRETGAQQQKILNYWTQMLTRLGDRRSDDFLKTFWTSRFGRIQRGRLFRELKGKFATKQQSVVLAKDLASASETYANLEIADGDLWRAHPVAAQEYVRALSLLGAKQTHPILLAALSRFDQQRMVSLLRHLVVLILRYQLVGRGRTGRLEIESARVAEGIYSARLKSPGSVWQELRQIIPPDDEFLEDLSRYEESRPERARWLLRELEAQEWKGQNPTQALQKAPLADPERVNLEHVLPRNPGAPWKVVTDADPALVGDCANRLGNLCLLDKAGNKQQAAKSFADKRALYAKSEFLLTRHLEADYTDWTRKEIEARQARLGKLALLAWPL